MKLDIDVTHSDKVPS